MADFVGARKILGAFADKQFRDDLASNARNLAQSASNTIADNVSAPVDGISWLLRKAGVDIPTNPVMGSDWMRQQGLTAETQHGPSAMAGETLGLLSPIAMTAGAPKIAKGLLQMGENAMAPRTMNPQAGAIVWHGSPHKFDKFDASKIGTGEGAQAYGHGLYLAESPEVAGQYAANVKDMGAVQRINAELSTLSDVMGKDAIPGAYRKYRTDTGSQAAKRYDELMAARDGVRTDPGSLYKVDLPDEHIAKMLDWDKPLSQQHPDVQAAVNGIKDGLPLSAEGWNPKPWIEADPLASTFHNTMHREGLLTQDAMSAALQKQGIPGIRYLDGGSRGAGQGSSNFVVFPGNEGMLSILERNGQPNQFIGIK